MGTMLKFESQSRISNFKFSTLPLDRPSSLSKMRRKFLASSAGEAEQQPQEILTSLPVPTVPPYPIELFESGGGLGHTNRAFNLTDEYLLAVSLKKTPAETAKASEGEVVRSARPSPEGAVYSVSGNAVLDEPVHENRESGNQHSDFLPNGRLTCEGSENGLLLSIGSIANVQESRDDINQNGDIPLKRSTPPGGEQDLAARNSGTVASEAQHMNSGPFSKNSAFSSVEPQSKGPHFPNGGLAPNGGLIPKSGPIQNGDRIMSGRHGPGMVPLMGGGLVPYKGPVPNGRLPQRGVAEHSGRVVASRVMMGGHMIRERQVPPGSAGARRTQSSSCRDRPASSAPRDPRSGHHRHHPSRFHTVHPRIVPVQEKGPVPVAHPPATGRVSEAGLANHRTAINHNQTNGATNGPDRIAPPVSHQGPGGPTDPRTSNGPDPIYSKVCKSNKRRKAKDDNGSHKPTILASRVLRSPTRPFGLVKHENHGSSNDLKPIVPAKKGVEETSSADADDISPLYEDLKDFEDDRLEERQRTIEVKIDYSRGSKYQMETRHVVKNKNEVSKTNNYDNSNNNNHFNNNNSALDKLRTKCEVKRDTKIKKKLKEVGEIKTFKLGVIHVVRVGKWRFVALCCCGNTNRYVHQPGRIEDYVPGHSSLSEKEQKKNPEADIKVEAKSQEPPPVSVNHRLGSQKMSMTHALKESGYESDSTLVFRKREDARRQPPDPRKTSQVYRQIQRGGDIPLTGLQKSAPAKPKDDYYVVYSDLDLGLHHPSLSDLAYARVSPRAMSPPAKPPVPTFGERKRSAPSKVSLAPSPPRRISSKWHPSLMKAYKDRPPIPSPRSTSAERVRETRALYSTWHREKVARSREKLGSSPARTNSLGRTSSSAKQSSEVRENFLKERRAVSESRFTLEDREKSPPRRTPSPPKASSPVRQADGREKLHHRASLKDVSPDKAGAYRSKVQEPLVTKGHSRSLSADAQRKWSNTSTESGMYSVTRHTVSSMNKIRRPSQQNAVDSRSSSADATCRRRRSSCLSPEPQLASRKSPVGRKDSRHRESPYSDVSLEVADDKKLKQSESFDTTQSNETGYSSMLDLSPSPVPDRRTEERRARKKSESPVRPHSAPAPRRSRYSHSFSEQRNKWEAITRGEAVGRRSRSPSRSTSPLRSLQLVRQVSSSFRNIPVEVFSESRRSRSLEVLTPSPHSHPQRYRQYILELRNAAPRNARISQLRRLFTSLERVHRLERSVSTVELSAADNRAHEIIDFETWKSMREKERKALEYNVLLKELNVAQKEREFLYKVTPEKKWAGDCRLRGRDVSVPELREKFDSLTDNSSEISQKRRQELENSKDTYRGLWRGSSVRDVSRMYESPERSRSSRRGSSLSLSREDSGIRARGLWTSLSLEQVNAFRDHLTEIYGSMQNVRSWRERKQMSMERTPNKSQRELAKYSVDVSETGRVLADKLRTLHVRPPPESTRRPPSRHSSPPRAAKSSSNVHQYEDQRRQLSKQLSIEFQEKVKEQKSGRRLESTPAMLDSLQVPDHPTSVSPESLSRSSPRTCYSLDISDSSEPNSLNSGDQFLLVVQKPGGHGRSNSLPPEQGSEADSSDSEMSVRTVVHKDVAGKVKFFEKRARRNSRSSERHSSRGSRLNIDEVPHYATLPSRLKQQSQNKLFSPNYLPERSVSSVNLANKGELSWRIYDKANPVSSSSIQRLSDQPKDKRDQVDPTSHSRSYLYHVKTGDVNRLKDRFESPEDARRRARSLPDMNGSLSRVTPSGKTVVRGQEAGDVQYMRAKYEAPRRSRSPERWQPSRDEYLPKSKLTNTLQSLASRSPAFCEPATVERLARRDSVEKAVLRRVHTGNVEASVDRLESQQTGSGVSIIGQMYTSAPSVNELANISTLVPPRPPPPLMGPQKPQRMAVRSNIQPLLTSTPTPSPRDARAVHKQRALQVTEPVCYPPSQLHPPPGASATFTRSSSSDYNADAHRPKSRYVPPESYGSPGSASHARGSWTQSLERPHRVTRAMTNTNPPAPSRGSSHCYTLRRHHQVHHAHHTPRAEHHSPSQPHPYSNTYSQITKPYQPYSHSPGRDQNYNNKVVSWKEPLIGPLPFPYLAGAHQHPPRRPESPYKYESGEVNIHYRTPVRIEQKEAIPEEELARRQEEHMKKVYEQERRKKYLAELEDIERRRHTDNFTPLQKSPIPLNRYDDESSLGTLRGNRTPEPKQVAKALYNFTAQNKRELTFNKGDVIFIRRSIDKNWYEGELRGSVGIFPCNYVEIVPYDHMKTLTRKPTEGQARARFNFQAQTSMEMSLSKGELVVLTRRVDENWYEGRIGARKGIFPVSYVDTLVEPGPDRPLTPSSSPMPRPALPAANLLYNGASSYSSPYSTLGRPGSQNDSRPYNQSLTVNTQQEPVAYRALYNYKPQNDDELELLEGDVVLVMEKCDDGWFVGTSRRTGLFGTFPGNYVERI